MGRIAGRGNPDLRSTTIMISKGNNHRRKPRQQISVGLIGAGFAARGFAMQCAQSKELSLIGVANRTPAHAKHMLSDIGASESGIMVSDKASDIISLKKVDVVVEATGDVEFGASVALEAIQKRKHIININAELDCTLGPILKKLADDSGVIYSQADGDQPGVIMNLIREAEFLGLTPVVAGNIKTFFDKYRTPETQKTWAHDNHQSTILATSAVDGTKLAAEMATVANATGFSVAIRGMHGPKLTQVEEAMDVFTRLPAIKRGGIVDYILGANPPFGVFVIAHSDKPLLREYLRLYKMGDGPYYLLYRPFHLCTLEAHRSVIDAARYNRATLAPKGLYCEVAALAKKDLLPGETIDGIGGFTVYGVAENSQVVRKDKLLPIGLSRGCVVIKPISKDDPITFSDVSLPEGRTIDELYRKQQELFPV